MIRPIILQGRSTGPFTQRWEYGALPHQIDYDVTQAPNYPMQIKAAVVVATGGGSTMMMMGVGM